jgi:hypothetical protein
LPIDKTDPLVEFKLGILSRALPAESAVVFGDIFRIDGGYTIECADRGCERVLLVDSLETPGWQRARLDHPQIDFRKGDFSDPLFMSSVKGTFDVGVLFDIMLHQPGLLGTLSMVLDRVGKSLCIVQPMLEEQGRPGSLVYLPGNPEVDELYPLEQQASDHQMFDVEEVNHSHWIWGLTPSFFTAAMRGMGFELSHEETLMPLPNPRWSWWGAVYERTKEKPASNWTTHLAYPGLYTGDW